MKRLFFAVAACASLAGVTTARAQQAYKCDDGNGGHIYQQSPCAERKTLGVYEEEGRKKDPEAPPPERRQQTTDSRGLPIAQE